MLQEDYERLSKSFKNLEVSHRGDAKKSYSDSYPGIHTSPETVAVDLLISIIGRYQLAHPSGPGARARDATNVLVAAIFYGGPKRAAGDGDQSLAPSCSETFN